MDDLYGLQKLSLEMLFFSSKLFDDFIFFLLLSRLLFYYYFFPSLSLSMIWFYSHHAKVNLAILMVSLLPNLFFIFIENFLQTLAWVPGLFWLRVCVCVCTLLFYYYFKSKYSAVMFINMNTKQASTKKMPTAIRRIKYL